ncbi:MAG: tetratricopeptide repeat protein [Polyangiaceae bacterium]|nr:tetratricopeptide repeat protein [Polyangiaceae bacterium]
MLLLRQVYLAHMEARRFEEALETARQMLPLEVLTDVAHQDAARACLGLGRRADAIEHLRLAGRTGPAGRRAFHLWTLGSVQLLGGEAREALGALERARRWATADRPLYAAQVALARAALGDDPGDLGRLREELEDAPCGRGYGQLVLGELAVLLGDPVAARRHLKSFVRRASGGRVALAVGLEAEIARARALLASLR